MAMAATDGGGGVVGGGGGVVGGGGGVGDTSLSRTLRAEIDSLREQNDELKLQNRERDRELADEREKAERVGT